MTILSILQGPDPLLLARAIEVRVFDSDLRSLANDMLETMYASGGCGLAAPQVGIGLQLIVMNFGVRGVGQSTERVMINPLVMDHSIQDSEAEERCLSFPGKVVSVRRWKTIDMHWHTMDAHRPRDWEKFRGLAARIVQHEVDHLEGKCIA